MAAGLQKLTKYNLSNKASTHFDQHTTTDFCLSYKMKSYSAFGTILASFFLSGTNAFTSPAFAASSVGSSTQKASAVGPLYSYVPDGLSAEQYERIKVEERRRLQGKDLARLGPRGFKSRSMEAWQLAYEKGQATHAFAPLNYKEKLQKGVIKKEDVPYMVRGGSWDNSDVSGARRLSWTKLDREYARGGYKKEQSASILGSGPGLDWTGTRPRGENLKRIVPGFS